MGFQNGVHIRFNLFSNFALYICWGIMLFIFWFLIRYLKSYSGLWFLIFNNTKFQHKKITRIWRFSRKWTSVWSLYGKRIVKIQKVTRLAHFRGSFPVKLISNVFWENKPLRMHWWTQISHAGTISNENFE